MPDFHADRTAGGLVEFDDGRRLLRLTDTGEIFGYGDVTAYELIESRGAIGRGALARAFSSSLFSFDGSYSVNGLKLRLVFGGEERFIKIMQTPVKSNTVVYKNLYAKGEAVIDEMRKICPDGASSAPAADYTEELRRLKKLADEGVITEEEFKAKKKQILGL